MKNRKVLVVLGTLGLVAYLGGAASLWAHDLPAAPDGGDFIGNLASPAFQPPPGNDAIFDHLTCYKIKDQKGRVAEHVMDLFPHEALTFPPRIGCTIKKKAVELCIDADKVFVSPLPPFNTDLAFPVGGPEPPGVEVPNAWDYMCYKMKCAKLANVPVKGIVVPLVVDQFGAGNITLVKESKVCAPILDKPIF